MAGTDARTCVCHVRGVSDALHSEKFDVCHSKILERPQIIPSPSQQTSSYNRYFNLQCRTGSGAITLGLSTSISDVAWDGEDMGRDMNVSFD